MKKILLTFIATLLASNVIAINKIDFISDSKDIYAGESVDGRYISIINQSSSKIARKDLVLDEWASFNTNEPVSTSQLSPNGQYQVWVNHNSTEIHKDLLRYYDYGSSTYFDLNYDIEEGEHNIVSKPEFVKGTNKIIFMSGVKGISAYEFYYTIHLKDILTGERVLVNPLMQETDFGWYSLNKVEISSDGKSMLYSMKNNYVAGDCCFVNPGYLVYYDMVTQSNTIILEQQDNVDLYDLFVLSGDGKTVVYQNGDDLIKYNVNDATHTIIDLSNNIVGNIHWMDISSDARYLAFMANGKFTDARASNYVGQFILNDELLGGENQIMQQRDRVLVVKDLHEQKADVINKLNNYQLFKASPLSLSSDGQVVKLMTLQQNSNQGFSKLYLSHEVDFSFKADVAITGTWFDYENPGQGLTINFAPSNQDKNGVAIVTWYTVDNDGNPLWLIMQALIDDNKLTGDAHIVTGSHFGEDFNSNEATVTKWGVMSLEFFNCKSASLSYEPELSGYEPGELNLTRLSYQVGLGCL